MGHLTGLAVQFDRRLGSGHSYCPRHDLADIAVSGGQACRSSTDRITFQVSRCAGRTQFFCDPLEYSVGNISGSHTVDEWGFGWLDVRLSSLDSNRPFRNCSVFLQRADYIITPVGCGALPLA